MRLLVLPILLLVALTALPALGQDLPVRTVTLNGIEIVYRGMNAGEPLVLIHSFGSCAEEK